MRKAAVPTIHSALTSPGSGRRSAISPLVQEIRNNATVCITLYANNLHHFVEHKKYIERKLMKNKYLQASILRN